MSRYIEFNDAVKVMACEMYAEAQSQGYDVDGVEDFIPEATAWMNDAPSIDLADYVPKEFHDKTCEAMAKRHQEEIANMVSVVMCKECKYASDNHVYGCMCNHFNGNDWDYHRMYAYDFCSRGERKESE